MSKAKEYAARSAAGEAFFIDESHAGADRLCAELFEVDGALYSIDPGWSDPYSSSHSIHKVPVDAVLPLFSWHPLNADHRFWLKYKKANPSTTRRELAWAALMRDLGREESAEGG